MSDICDLAQHQIDQELERNLKAAQCEPMPEGQPGECAYCGYHSPRLVHGACARCRDAQRLN